MIQSWVEVRVTDERGAVIFSSGLRDKRSFLEPGTFLFKAEPVDQYGNLIDRHNLWEMVGVRYRRSLFPGYSDNVEYNVMCPSGGPLLDARKVEAGHDFEIAVAHAGAMRIDATLHYRKIDQFLLNYVLGEKPGLTSPVADIASASAAVAVSAASRNERHAESSRH
jgi:hypothetical protein